MPLTGAERTRRYREKLKQNRSEEFEAQRKKNLARLKEKTKKISELTPKQAKERREKWRKEQRAFRQKRKYLVNKKVTQSPTLETNTHKINETVIHALRRKNRVLVNKCRRSAVKIENFQKEKERYRKLYQRHKLKYEKEKTNLKLQIEKMKARHEVLESTLKKTNLRCKTHDEKKTLKKLVQHSADKSMITSMLGLKNKIRTKQKKIRRTNIIETTNFYTRDDVSRNTSGKRETRTKSKEKQQIRYLLDTLINTFKKYKSEGGRYGFTTFYNHKPFFVLSPRLSSRKTCECIKHCNFSLKHSALVKHGVINVNSHEVLNYVSCDKNNYDCMTSNCEKCKDKEVPFELTGDILEKRVEWQQWERQDYTYIKKDGETNKEVKTKRVVKATKNGNINDLKKEYERQLKNYKEHHFNMLHQQRQYQKAVADLKENEALIVCVFSENYEAKLSTEIQSMHFGASKRQITLHTGMVFWKNCAQSFCTISDDNNHQSPAIWAHLIPIVEMVKRDTPKVTVIHFYSDGPSSQYRQKGNFYLLAHFANWFRFSYATWSFFEAGHGKSVADGIGGCVKRFLDKKVTYNVDVANANDAYNLLKKTRVKVFLISSCDIENVSKIIPAKLPILKGCMKLHQISTCLNEKFKIRFRNISCFCGELRGQCECFAPKTHCVALELIMHNNDNMKCNETSTLSEFGLPENIRPQEDILENLPEVDLDIGLDWLNSPIPIELSIIDEISNQISESASLEHVIFIPLDSKVMINQNDIDKISEKNEKFATGTEASDNKVSIHTVNTNVTGLSENMNAIDVCFDKNEAFENVSRSKDVQPTASVIKNVPNRNRPLKDVTDNHTRTRNRRTYTNKRKVLSTFLECNKCHTSILAAKGKCIVCKNWYCDDCIGTTFIYSDYICDSCLEG